MLQPLGPTPSDAHAQETSTGLADVQTLVAPEGARAVLLTASTNGCYLTVDGSTPSSTNGIPLPAAGVPYLLPIPGDIKFASQAAGNSVVNALWLC